MGYSYFLCNIVVFILNYLCIVVYCIVFHVLFLKIVISVQHTSVWNVELLCNIMLK